MCVRNSPFSEEEIISCRLRCALLFPSPGSVTSGTLLPFSGTRRPGSTRTAISQMLQLHCSCQYVLS